MAQHVGGRAKNSGIDLPDTFFGRTCILFFYDADDSIILVAHDATVSGGVIHRLRKQSQARLGHEVLECVIARKWDVAIQHQSGSSGLQVRQGLLHRVPGTELRVLAYEFDGRVCECRWNRVTTVAIDDDRAIRCQRGGSL
jgi:hypothetical protein